MVDPCNVVNLNNYAAFLAEIRKDFEQAEVYFRKAVDVDPTCGFAVRNLLNFLVYMLQDEKAAKDLWEQGGAEALNSACDETYHPDEICQEVRADMAAEAKFMMIGRQLLLDKAIKAGYTTEVASCSSCVSCGQNVACCVVDRQCESTCEGHTCLCIDVKWCVSCVLQHYWHDTNSELKSFARCPTCRAEFCLADVVVSTVDTNRTILTDSEAATRETLSETLCRCKGECHVTLNMDMEVELEAPRA